MILVWSFREGLWALLRRHIGIPLQPEVITHTVSLYHRFPLSFRDPARNDAVRRTPCREASEKPCRKLTPDESASGREGFRSVDTTLEFLAGSSHFRRRRPPHHRLETHR